LTAAVRAQQPNSKQKIDTYSRHHAMAAVP
jgi:hypothetical protein